MTYVLSDIHGNMDAFESILSQINLQPNDDLYILGDVIDRHPYGIEIIQKIMNTPNMHMIIGNHEHMMLETLGHPYGNKQSDIRDVKNVWTNRNGGQVTYDAYNKLSDEEQQKVVDFLSHLPLEYDIEVNDTKFHLCHSLPKYLADEIDEFRWNIAYECIWNRDWLEQIPYLNIKEMTIIGHTPVHHFVHFDDVPFIVQLGDSVIDIDCGAGFPNDMKPSGRLSCICLDDMKEFYSSTKN